MSLSPRSRLGPYEIGSPIGAGAIGDRRLRLLCLSNRLAVGTPTPTTA
jgi:hypothetical protein